MGRPLLSAPWGRGPGTLWVGFPSPAPPAAPTCRVGSRAASWESCSLKALSFSSYWLGEGQAASSPRGGQLASPGDHRMGRCHCPASFAYPSPPASLCPEPPCLPHWPLGCSLPRAGRGLARLSERRLGGRAGTPLTSAQPAAAALSSPPVCPGRDSLLPTWHAQPCGRPAPALGLRYTLALRPACRPGSLSLRPACLHPAAWESQSPRLKHHLLGEVLPDQPHHQRQLG